MRARRFSNHPFELGLFSFNVSGGLAQTQHDIWKSSWENNVAVARAAEEAGLEFLLPLGRWRSHRDPEREPPVEGGSFETLTWASGLLALTERIAIFGTLHVGYVNPMFAAKQVVTAHHIGRGRFGLNVVSGTVPADYAMFGIPFGDHDARYDYTEEWVTVAKRIWTETEPFDHDGEHFHLRSVLAKPKPYGRELPMLISAGHSHRGRAFAMRHADALFTSITEMENAPAELAAARASTAGGAQVPIYGSGHLICRPTSREADEYQRYLVDELGYWEGLDELVALKSQNRTMPFTSIRRFKERIITGGGTFAIRGSYDEVVQQFQQLHAAGLDGMAIALVDYLADLPALRDEVIPRLERAGLRTCHAERSTVRA